MPTEILDTKVVKVLFETETLRQFLYIFNREKIPAPSDPNRYLEIGIKYLDNNDALFEFRIVSNK